MQFYPLLEVQQMIFPIFHSVTNTPDSFHLAKKTYVTSINERMGLFRQRADASIIEIHLHTQKKKNKWKKCHNSFTVWEKANMTVANLDYLVLWQFEGTFTPCI